jgi:hypothetical protein
MRGAIPPLPQYVFMAWCLVKHRDFTFSFYFAFQLCFRGIHQLVFCADDFNMLGSNINTTQINRETLLQTSREVGISIWLCLVSKTWDKITIY